MMIACFTNYVIYVAPVAATASAALLNACNLEQYKLMSDVRTITSCAQSREECTLPYIAATNV